MKAVFLIFIKPFVSITGSVTSIFLSLPYIISNNSNLLISTGFKSLYIIVRNSGYVFGITVVSICIWHNISNYNVADSVITNKWFYLVSHIYLLFNLDFHLV